VCTAKGVLQRYVPFARVGQLEIGSEAVSRGCRSRGRSRSSSTDSRELPAIIRKGIDGIGSDAKFNVVKNAPAGPQDVGRREPICHPEAWRELRVTRRPERRAGWGRGKRYAGRRRQRSGLHAREAI